MTVKECFITPASKVYQLTLVELIATGNSSNVYTVTSNCNPVNRSVGQQDEIFILKRISIAVGDHLYQGKMRLYETLKKLNHENVVKYLDYGKDNTNISLGEIRLCFLQEYISGGTLTHHCSNFDLDEKYVAYYTSHILKGLEYLHSLKPSIIHGDLKGDNVLLTHDKKTAKICDLDDSKLMKRSKTQKSDVPGKIGTMCFMSPEMLSCKSEDGAKNPGRSTDIWSLGCIILQIIGKGEFYFTTKYGEKRSVKDYGIEFKIMISEEGRPDIPKTLSEPCQLFIRECLERNPKLRPNASNLSNHRFLDLSSNESVPAIPNVKTYQSAESDGIMDQKSTRSEISDQEKENTEVNVETTVTFTKPLVIHGCKYFGDTVCTWHPKKDLLATCYTVRLKRCRANVWNFVDLKESDIKNSSLWQEKVIKGELVYALDTKISDSMYFPLSRCGRSSGVQSLDWNEKGQYLCTGSDDGSIRIWTADRNLQSTLKGHKTSVTCVKWNKSASHIISSCQETVIVWDVTTNKMEQRFSYSKKKDCKFDAPVWKDDQTFAYHLVDQEENHNIYIHRKGLSSKEPLKLFRTGSDVTAMEWDPQGRLLATAGGSKYCLKLWSMDNDKPVLQIPTANGNSFTNFIKWGPSGPGTKNPNEKVILASACHLSNEIRLWDVEKGTNLHILPGSGYIHAITFSPDSNFLAVSTSREKDDVFTISVFAFATGKIVRKFNHSCVLESVSWNYNGSKLAASDQEGTVVILDTQRLSKPT